MVSLDRAQFRQVVLWLENNKIQHYDSKEREGLESLNNDSQWKAAYVKYLNDLVRLVIGVKLEFFIGDLGKKFRKFFKS